MTNTIFEKFEPRFSFLNYPETTISFFKNLNLDFRYFSPGGFHDVSGRRASSSNQGSSFRAVLDSQSELGELPVVRHIRKHAPSVPRASSTPEPGGIRPEPPIPLTKKSITLTSPTKMSTKNTIPPKFSTASVHLLVGLGERLRQSGRWARFFSAPKLTLE